MASMASLKLARTNRSKIRLTIIKNVPKVLLLLFVFVILTSLRLTKLAKSRDTGTMLLDNNVAFIRLTKLAKSRGKGAMLDNNATSIQLVHQKVTQPKLNNEVKIVQEINEKEDNVIIDVVEEEYEVIECFDNPSSVFEDDAPRPARVKKEVKNDAMGSKRFSQRNNNISLDIQLCPICFGKSQCEEISENFKVTAKHSKSLVKINGTWKTNMVTLINFGNTKTYKEFDDLIYKLYQEENTPRNRKHSPLQQFVETPVFPVQSVYNEILKDIYTNTSNNIISSHCINNKLLSKLQELYAGKISNQHDYNAYIGYFVTTLMVKPDIIIYKFVEQYASSVVKFLPELYGVCGRGFVIGNDGSPLYQFLSSPWTTRVHLAIQLLDLIDYLINSSTEWELIILKFDFNSFIVTSSGQLVLKDIDHFVIVDKTQENTEEDGPFVDACNKQCLSEITFELKSATTLCKGYSLRPYSHVMFLIACMNILSDSNDQKGEQYQKIGGMGLLHAPVGRQSSYVSELLASCVHEASFGARIATVNKLRHILKQLS